MSTSSAYSPMPKTSRQSWAICVKPDEAKGFVAAAVAAGQPPMVRQGKSVRPLDDSPDVRVRYEPRLGLSRLRLN